MKNIEEYMKMPHRMEFVPDEEEGGYAVFFPELPGCITCGESVEEAFSNALDAKRSWIEACLADGREIPLPNEIAKYSGQFKLRLPKSLHRSLAEHSRQEGVSMNQYCVYLLAKNDGTPMNALG